MLEKSEVERLLKKNDEETISYLDQLTPLLDNSETVVNTDLEKIWKNVDSTTDEIFTKSRFNLFTPLKIAAAILIMAVSSFVLLSFLEEEVKNEEIVSTVVKHTKRGENLTVRLPDGTMVSA